MNRTNLTVHIIPSSSQYYQLEDYNEAEHGKTLSNAREIKVNQVRNGYTIVYGGDVFKRLNMDIFGTNVIKLFQTNLPNSVIDVYIAYHYELAYDDDKFDTEVAEKIFQLDQIMIKMSRNTFRYHRSESVVETIEYYQDINDPDEEDEYDPFGEDDNDEDDFDMDDIFGFLNAPNKGSKKNKSKPDSYGRSKVFKNANNPKRAYRRHGVLVAASKDDIRRDEKILKEFLKDFFPGNSDWKKDFRRDLLKRWIRMYVVSKKKLKELEHDYRKSKSSKKSSVNTDKALDFTRRLFNVPLDRWNDPSK